MNFRKENLLLALFVLTPAIFAMIFAPFKFVLALVVTFVVFAILIVVLGRNSLLEVHVQNPGYAGFITIHGPLKEESESCRPEFGFRKTWCVHIGLTSKDWFWGYEEDWYNGRLPCIGFGPIFLITWIG